MAVINSVGMDIGGANIKLAYVSSENNKILDKRVIIRYFPIWRRGKERLLPVLREVLTCLPDREINIVAATMTAELSDIYFSKEEGVNHILDVLLKIFSEDKIRILNVYGELIPIEEAREEYIMVASANWYATGWLVSRISETALAIDIGSTTTSIIPVYKGRIYARGLNDVEKLVLGELVYTGALRTNVVSIVHEVPYRDNVVPVSSEYFAQSADVNLVLGKINEKDYNVDTPDGRGPTYYESLARIARVICGDLNILSEGEIIEISKYIYEKQVEKISSGINRLIKNIGIDFRKYPAYIAGVGSFLARDSLIKLGFKDIRALGDYIGYNAASAVPSYALAIMGLEYYRGVK